MTKMNGEVEYLNALKNIYENGKDIKTEHGIGTRYLQGVTIAHDMSEGWPLLTTKAMNWKHQVAEVLWYLSGTNDITEMQKHLKYWNAWADESNKVQSAYGNLWRNFPVPATDGYTYLIDQLLKVVQGLKNNPNSRRYVVTAWNPSNAWNSNLPPCHFAFHLRFDGDHLNLSWVQRSADFPLGVPYNMAQYAIILSGIAQTVGMKPGRLTGHFFDAHIYENQLDGVAEQLHRTTKQLPTLTVPDKTILEWGWEDMDDFHLDGYDPDTAIKYILTEVGVK